MLRPIRLADEKRDLERTPLNRHQPRQRLVQYRREQIADRCERDLQLGLRRARREDAEATLVREANSRLPERGLADSRVALEQQRTPAGGESLEEFAQRGEFFAPTDDLV